MATITIPAKDLLVYTQIAREEIIKKYGDRIVQAMKELSERNFIVQFFSPNYDSVHSPIFWLQCRKDTALATIATLEHCANANLEGDVTLDDTEIDFITYWVKPNGPTGNNSPAESISPGIQTPDVH